MTFRKFSLLLAVLLTFGFSGEAFAAKPKVMAVADLKPGTKAIGFSVFRGVEPEPFDVVLGEATQMFGLNLILARIYGSPPSLETPLEKTGPIAGMSGSPIFIGCDSLEDCIGNGTLVGALSYGVASLTEGGMNFMLTPAEYMLGARAGGYGAVYTLNRLLPRISFRGMEYNNLMLSPKMDGLANEVGISAKCPDASGQTLKPGSMIAIYLAWGTIPIAAAGTVTWVDGNSVYVFGHPFFGSGVVHFPFAHVSVAATIQTPLSPYKVAGCYLDTSGLMTVDGAYEVSGVIGVSPSLLSYHIELHVNGRLFSFLEEVAPSPSARAIINVLPVRWANNLLGDINRLSVAYWARIVIRDQPEIFLKNVIPAQIPSNDSPYDAVISRLDEVIFKNLDVHGLTDRIEKIQVHADLVNDLMVWRAKTSFLSQTSASPGETVFVNIVLEEFSSGTVKQISIPIRVPDDFGDLIEPGDPSTISVIVQSGYKFKPRQDTSAKTPASLENYIRELNLTMNRATNVLYVQQIMPRSKGDKENNRALAKASSRPSGNWSDIGAGELNQLPSIENLDVVLNTTPPLEHFIDFDASFDININVKPKTEPASLPGKKKGRKWFFLFLR